MADEELTDEKEFETSRTRCIRTKVVDRSSSPLYREVWTQQDDNFPARAHACGWSLRKVPTLQASPWRWRAFYADRYKQGMAGSAKGALDQVSRLIDEWVVEGPMLID